MGPLYGSKKYQARDVGLFYRPFSLFLHALGILACQKKPQAPSLLITSKTASNKSFAFIGLVQ